MSQWIIIIILIIDINISQKLFELNLKIWPNIFANGQSI